MDLNLIFLQHRHRQTLQELHEAQERAAELKWELDQLRAHVGSKIERVLKQQEQMLVLVQELVARSR